MTLKIGNETINRISIRKNMFRSVKEYTRFGFIDSKGNDYFSSKVGFGFAFTKNTNILAWYDDGSYNTITEGPDYNDYTFYIIGSDYVTYSSMNYWFAKCNNQNLSDAIFIIFDGDMRQNTNLFEQSEAEAPIKLGSKNLNRIAIGDNEFIGVDKTYDDGTFDDFAGNNYIKSKTGSVFKITESTNVNWYGSDGVFNIYLNNTNEQFTITGEVYDNNFSPLYWLAISDDNRSTIIFKTENLSNVNWITNLGGVTNPPEPYISIIYAIYVRKAA